MTYEDIILIDTASRHALKAATALDRLQRNVECDLSPVKAFLADVATVYGTVPDFLMDGVDSRDPVIIEFLKAGALGIHDKALDVRPHGPFETETFEDLLAASKPLTSEFMAEINALVGGIDVDLDKPTDGAVKL